VLLVLRAVDNIQRQCDCHIESSDVKPVGIQYVKQPVDLKRLTVCWVPLIDHVYAVSIRSVGVMCVHAGRNCSQVSDRGRKNKSENLKGPVHNYKTTP
jgi:hypothetical protein